MRWPKALLPGIGALLFCACQPDSSAVPALPAEPVPSRFEDSQGFSGRNAWLHAKQLCDLGPRPNGSEALALSRKYITGELQKQGWTVSEQVFTSQTPLGKRQFVNLLARFQPEQGPKVPVGLLSGHIDTKLYPGIRFIGANDGASHTGLLLEFSRVLAKSPERARQIELVFFDGEEAFGERIEEFVDGLYGSQYYAKFYRGKAAGQKPQWAINADMVGHKRLKLAVPSDTPNQLYQVYKASARSLPRGERRFGVAPGSIKDDHLHLNLAGIPAIDLIAGDFSGSSWWHREGDTLEILSPASLELSGQLISNMLELLLTQKDS